MYTHIKRNSLYYSLSPCCHFNSEIILRTALSSALATELKYTFGTPCQFNGKGKKFPNRTIIERAVEEE
jgi:hypothetical protein